MFAVIYLFNLLSSQTPGNYWSVYHLYSLATSRMVYRFVTFADWLLSLSNMPLRLIHVFTQLDSSFILPNSTTLFDCTNLFIHSLTEDILVAFIFWWLWTSFLKTFLCKLFVWKQGFKLVDQIATRATMAGLYGKIMFSFLKKLSNCFPKWLY